MNVQLAKNGEHPIPHGEYGVVTTISLDARDFLASGRLIVAANYCGDVPPHAVLTVASEPGRDVWVVSAVEH